MKGRIVGRCLLIVLSFCLFSVHQAQGIFGWGKSKKTTTTPSRVGTSKSTSGSSWWPFGKKKTTTRTTSRPAGTEMHTISRTVTPHRTPPPLPPKPTRRLPRKAPGKQGSILGQPAPAERRVSRVGVRVPAQAPDEQLKAESDYQAAFLKWLSSSALRPVTGRFRATSTTLAGMLKTIGKFTPSSAHNAAIGVQQSLNKLANKMAHPEGEPKPAFNVGQKVRTEMRNFKEDKTGFVGGNLVRLNNLVATYAYLLSNKQA